MNCLEFRRQLGIDPDSSDAAFLAHRDDCARCAAAARTASAFEMRLADALALPVPAGLVDHIQLAQTTGLRGRQRDRRSRNGWIVLAAAACLALALGLVQWRGAQTPPLPDLVVSHVMGESSALISRTPVPDVLVRREFALRGVTLATVPADITWVNDCPLGPWRSVHMVMPMHDEPVTVMYIPRRHAERQNDFDRGMWQGREVPLGDGTLILLAEDSSSFDALEHSWRSAIEGAPDVAAGSR